MQQTIPGSELPELADEFNPLMNHTLDGDMNAARWAHDHKLTIKFRRAAVLNPHKSSLENRAIFDEKDFITIFTPGSQLSVVDAPMDSGFYMQRFGKQYREWVEGVANAISGTPIEHFPFLFQKVGLQAELKALHIHTVEQLADLPDSGLQKFMGGQELRREAQKWLSKTKTDADDAEKLELKQQLAALQAQMAVLMGKSQDQAAPKAAVKEK